MAHPHRTCPHCDSPLQSWRVPDGASWDEELFFVCFNDECSYFQRGWTWMREQYNQTASYRYMINPATGSASPLPVWSGTATRNMIVDNGEEGGA